MTSLEDQEKKRKRKESYNLVMGSGANEEELRKGSGDGNEAKTGRWRRQRRQCRGTRKTENRVKILGRRRDVGLT